MVCCALLPLLIISAIILAPNDKDGETVYVGVFAPSDRMTGDALFFNAIKTYENDYAYPLRFVEAESEEQALEKVAAGAWECGYAIPSDLGRRVREGERDRLITRYDSPSSVMGAVINEAIAAAVLDICAPDIAFAYMEGAGILPPETRERVAAESDAKARNPVEPDAQAENLAEPDASADLIALLEERVALYFHPSRLIKARVEFIDTNGNSRAASGAGDGSGSRDTPDPSSGNRSGSSAAPGQGAGNGSGSSAAPGRDTAVTAGQSLTVPTLIRGLIAIYMFLYSCLCSVWFIGDRGSGFYQRLAPYLKPGVLYMPYFWASAVFAAAGAMIALMIARLYYPVLIYGFFAEFLCLTLYLVYLTNITYFLAGIFRTQETLASTLPFALSACLLFCPVFIDLGAYIPYVRVLSNILPPTFYLRLVSSLSAATLSAAGFLGLVGYLIAAVFLYGAARFYHRKI